MADLTSNTDGLQEVLDMIDSRIVDTSQFQPKITSITLRDRNSSSLIPNGGGWDYTYAGTYNLADGTAQAIEVATFIPIEQNAGNGICFRTTNSAGYGVIYPELEFPTNMSTSTATVYLTGMAGVYTASADVTTGLQYTNNYAFLTSTGINAGELVLRGNASPTSTATTLKYNLTLDALEFIFS